MNLREDYRAEKMLSRPRSSIRKGQLNAGASFSSPNLRSGIRLERPIYSSSKRIIDVGFCIASFPLLVPLLLVIGIAVWLESPGSVIYTQLRTGKGGRRFKMYKFRTMVPNAHELKKQYAHLNELTLPDFKITNDPRITRVGKFLRKTSLDELPQWLNVLRGQMSWVGPRPTSFSAETYSLWHTERLEVTPGITGLWQISGRSDVDFDERNRLDIEYIENRSLKLDLLIIWKTVFVVIKKRGAY